MAFIKMKYSPLICSDEKRRETANNRVRRKESEREAHNAKPLRLPNNYNILISRGPRGSRGSTPVIGLVCDNPDDWRDIQINGGLSKYVTGIYCKYGVLI